MKTIQAYESQGLHVDYVSLNNEPTCCKEINYPSILLITSGDMATMLKEYWFPAFKANHITTKILLLDFNWNNVELVQPLLQDTSIRESIDPAGALGRVVALPQIGGLHHRYERRAA